MTRRTVHTGVAMAFAFACAMGAAPVLVAQGGSATMPDLNGEWQGPYTPNLEQAYGKPLPFTPVGAERWKHVETKNDPTGRCLPVGPARSIQSPFPFMIVQSKAAVGLLFEYQRIHRIIYTDGRKAPEDIEEYPEWMGFSTGRWEGDVLVVDTDGIDERTWLDTAGHEHSGKMKLTERFRKTGANTIEWNVTFSDPVFFTQPWSITRTITRLKPEDRVMSYSCNENNLDVQHLVETKK